MSLLSLNLCLATGAAAPWSPNLAVYDASTGTTQPASTSSAGQRDMPGLGAVAGFCGAHSGEPLWVGMPGISAICDSLADNERIMARRNCKATTHLPPHGV